MPSRKAKKLAGRVLNPMRSPSGMKGRAVPMTMPSVVMAMTGFEARDWMKGIFGVRRAWMTKVCVQMDVTNHAVWKSAMKPSCDSGSREKNEPPNIAGPNPKNITTKVRMSNTELVGPSQTMKRCTELASQPRGFCRNSSSTLSQGMAVQLMS